MPEITKTTEPDLITQVEELLAKATPGPWMYRANPDGTKENWSFHIDRQGTPGRMNWGILIAACWAHVSESAEANAKLIAAAPELLRRMVEEVKTLRAVIRNGSPVGKLTAASVAEIKAALRSGASGSYLAEKYGVTDTTISLIKRGRTWRHVE